MNKMFEYPSLDLAFGNRELRIMYGCSLSCMLQITMQTWKRFR